MTERRTTFTPAEWDSLCEFLRARTVDKPGGSISLTSITSRWKGWARAQGHGVEPTSSLMFILMTRAGFELTKIRDRTGRIRLYVHGLWYVPGGTPSN